MNHPSPRRFFVTLFSWGLIALLWFGWLFGGAQAFWYYLHHFLWQTTSSEELNKAIFAPVTAKSGNIELHSFFELQSGKLEISSFDPPPGLIGGSKQLFDLVKPFNQPNEYRMGELHGASLREIHGYNQPKKFELTLYLSNGAEWHWRYAPTQKGVVLIDWYEIHDTAGCSGGPVFLLALAVTFPLAYWGTKLIRRTSQSYSIKIRRDVDRQPLL